MKTFALAIAALAIVAAADIAAIKSLSAAEATAGMPATAPFPPFPANSGPVAAEGAPCAPTMRDGRSPHYTWKAGYVQKGRWEYHWACEL